MGSMHLGIEDDGERLAAFYAERARGGAGLIVTGGSSVTAPAQVDATTASSTIPRAQGRSSAPRRQCMKRADGLRSSSSTQGVSAPFVVRLTTGRAIADSLAFLARCAARAHRKRDLRNDRRLCQWRSASPRARIRRRRSDGIGRLPHQSIPFAGHQSAGGRVGRRLGAADAFRARGLSRHTRARRTRIPSDFSHQRPRLDGKLDDRRGDAAVCARAGRRRRRRAQRRYRLARVLDSDGAAPRSERHLGAVRRGRKNCRRRSAGDREQSPQFAAACGRSSCSAQRRFHLDGAPVLADAQILAKASRGQAHLVNTCIACNQACIDLSLLDVPVSCMVNPRAGRERAFPEDGTLPAAPAFCRHWGGAGRHGKRACLGGAWTSRRAFRSARRNRRPVPHGAPHPGQTRFRRRSATSRTS